MARDDPRLHASAPTLEIHGQSYPLLARNLESMSMREALGGLSSLELTFADALGNGRFAASGDSPLRLGNGVRVFAGAASENASEIFDGQITAVEGEYTTDERPPLFTILAEDRLFAARRRRRSKLFEETSLGDLVSEVAQEYGLQPEIRAGVDETVRDWLQTDETDLAFLRRVLGRFDCDLQVVGDRLQVGRVGMDQRSLVPLMAGETLISARVTADLADQVSSISLASFDPATGEDVSSEEDSVGFGPGQGVSAADILTDRMSPVLMHSGRRGPLSDPDAATLAELAGQCSARSFVRIDGTAQGNANLRVGSWIELAGVNPMFENRYAVREAIHHWSREEGYLTDFIAECAYLKEGI
ncbi:MAG: contractile injection system protein, VgrG/Pvc8 family [Pseudomonadota bacterium]